MSNPTYLTGGEIGIPQAAATPYAADIGTNSPAVELVMGSSLDPVSGGMDGAIFLMDEGVSGYGTLFGEVFGGPAGQATSISGATVIGPATNSGSGKVTCWHASGLYGLSIKEDSSGDATGAAGDPWKTGETVSGYTVNDALVVETGKWVKSTDSVSGIALRDGADAAAGANGIQDPHRVCGYYMGSVEDASLVSTSTFAATGTAGADAYHAVYFLGAGSMTIHGTIG
jgi:hypothetical protein